MPGSGCDDVSGFAVWRGPDSSPSRHGDLSTNRELSTNEDMAKPRGRHRAAGVKDRGSLPFILGRNVSVPPQHAARFA